MTFATEIAKRRTTRATLVRLNPGRYISGELVSEGSGIYAMPNTRIISSIKRNGTALTADTTDPTVNDHYYYNETTGEITVKLASAPNGTTNVVIAYYYLFYTSGSDTVYYQTPTDSATTKRYWEPRLKSDASFRESLDGLEAGIISVSDSSIDIENADFTFEANLGTKDSFYNKSCVIWQDINGQISQIYNGYVYSVSSASNTISLSLSNQLSLLDKTAYIGDLATECIHLSGIRNSDLGRPIPIHLSELTWRDINLFIDYYSVIPLLLTAGGLAGICSDYSTTASTSTNREWTLCRSKGGLSTQSFGTISSVTATGSNYEVAYSSLSNVNVGDTIKWTEAAVVGYGTVTGVSGNTLVFLRSSGAASITTASTMTALKSHCIILEELSTGTKYYPKNIRDFTLAETATAGGNKQIIATFINNFEATVGISNPLSPEYYKLHYFMQNTGTFTHGTILKYILDAAGLTTNAASFTTADSDLTDETAFSIPFISETEYSNYVVYAQAILASTLGYVRNNSSSEIEYKLIAAPASPVSRTTSDYMESGINYDIEYRDIITQIIPYNDHLAKIGSTSVDNSSESTKSKYLHDTINSEKFPHVLAGDANGNIGRQAEILARRSNRRINYRYRTETMDLSTSVGDGHTAEWDSLASVEIFIIGLDKSENETVITGIDLFDI